VVDALIWGNVVHIELNSIKHIEAVRRQPWTQGRQVWRWSRYWLPVGKSGYRPVTGNLEHPRKTEISNKKTCFFLNYLNLNAAILDE
jgi:hypothetical protein